MFVSSNNRSEKKCEDPLCSLHKVNPLKRKQVLKGTKTRNDKKKRKENDDEEVSLSYNGSALTFNELTQLWKNYKTHGHFRASMNEITNETSNGKLDDKEKNNKCLTESKNFLNSTSDNNQSIHIVSKNTWNWAKVTEINQSNSNFSDIKVANFEDGRKENNNFIELLTKKEQSLQMNRIDFSETEPQNYITVNNNTNNNHLVVNDLGSLEPYNNHGSLSNQFNLNEYKENIDPNIQDYIYNQNNYNPDNNWFNNHEHEFHFLNLDYQMFDFDH